VALIKKVAAWKALVKKEEGEESCAIPIPMRRLPFLRRFAPLRPRRRLRILGLVALVARVAAHSDGEQDVQGARGARRHHAVRSQEPRCVERLHNACA